jgi:hypothetical protein
VKPRSLYAAATGMIGVAGTILASLYTPRRFAFGVVLGVLFAVGNLVLLGRIVPTVLAPSPLDEPSPEKKRFWALVAAFKFLVMLAVLGYALSSGAVDALGIALGTFALPAGLAIVAML